MADNTIQAQHITELDFDISKMHSQMQEIEKMLISEGNKLEDIVKKNWKIGDIVGDKNGIQKDLKTITLAMQEYERLIKKIQEAERNRSISSNNVYSINEKTFRLLNQISGLNTKDANSEKLKLKTLKDQTNELVKHLQLNGKLSIEQEKQLATYKKQLQKSENNVTKLNTTNSSSSSVSNNKTGLIDTVSTISSNASGMIDIVSSVKNLGSKALTKAFSITAIVTTIVDVVSGIISAIKQKKEEEKQKARQEILEQTQKATEEYDTFNNLVEQYKSIGDKVSYTAEEKQKLIDIQKQLNDLYGVESNNIDIVNGKYDEQIEKLDGMSKTQLEELTNKQILSTNSALSQFNEKTPDIFNQNHIKGKPFSRDLFKDIENLGFKGDTEGQGEYFLEFSFKGDAVQKYNAMTQVLQRMREKGLDTTDMYKDMTSKQGEYGKICRETMTTLQKEIGISEKRGDNDERLSENKKKLSYLQSEYGKTIEDTNNKSTDLNNANILSGNRYSELTAKISAAESSLRTLNDVLENVKNGEVISDEQTLDLIENYGLAESAVTKVAGGYTIEQSALENLRQAKIQDAATSRQAQIESDIATAKGVANRLGMYQNEVGAIKDLATAKQAMATIEDGARRNINSETDYKQYFELTSKLAPIIKAYENIDFMKTNFYGGIGDITSTMPEVYPTSPIDNIPEAKIEQSLGDITKAFDRLVSLGLKSTSEQITYYETLLKTMNLTEDNATSVENKLHDLYKQKFNERMDMLDKEKEAKINSINSVYDKQIEALKLTKEANQKQNDEEEYTTKKGKLNEELSYYKQRSGPEARENEKKKLEEIAELEKEHQRKLDEEKIDKQITDLETQKSNEVKAIEDKYKEIKDLFTSTNIELIATAGQYAPQLYNQFCEFFTNPFENKINNLKTAISQLTGINVPNAPTSTGAGSYSAPAQAAQPTQSINSGSRVKIKSSAGNYGGQSSNVAIPNSYKNKPYTVSYLGYNNTQALIKELYSWVRLSDLVQARTGGYTLADGVTMLHKNELVVNDDLTKQLRQMTNSYNGTSNYNNSKQTVINYNAPLYNVQQQSIADKADLNIIKNDISRKILKSINNKI